MRKFGFSAALIAVASAMGGIAGFNPSDPYRFVPIAGRRNIGRDNLKRSRNSIHYPEPNKIGGRQQTRNARQMAAGKLAFFDHDANRKMIALRKLNKELDAPLPEITIGDYVEDGVTVAAFIEDRDATLAPEIAEENAKSIEKVRDRLFPHQQAMVDHLEATRDLDKSAKIGASVGKSLAVGLVSVTPAAMDILRAIRSGNAAKAGKHRDNLRDLGLIAYDKAAHSWIVTDAGRAVLNKGE